MDKHQFLDDYLEKMVQYLLNHEEIKFKQSVQDFVRDHHCIDIPMPHDRNTTKLALKAALVERLVEIMNSFPRFMHEQAPAWCSEIGPGERELKLAADDVLELESEYCQPFYKRNIYATKNFMFFI